jgi:hypothetical protein
MERTVSIPQNPARWFAAWVALVSPIQASVSAVVPFVPVRTRKISVPVLEEMPMSWMAKQSPTATELAGMDSLCSKNSVAFTLAAGAASVA